MARKTIGPTLIGLVAIAELAAVIAVYATLGTDEEGVRVALRLTARVSLVLFLATFVASSVNRLVGGPVGKFLLRERRYLGVAFAVSHIIHLGTIGMRASLHSAGFWAERTVGSLVPGMTVYLLILLMLITSTDGAARRLGRTPWTVLHKVGMYAIFAIFVGSYGRKPLDEPLVLGPLILLGFALALRALARAQIIRKKRAKKR